MMSNDISTGADKRTENHVHHGSSQAPHGSTVLWQKWSNLSCRTTTTDSSLTVIDTTLFVEVKKGKPCTLNRGCRLQKKKEGQLKVSKHESRWHEQREGKKRAGKKSKMALQALVASRGSWQLPWKPVMITKSMISMAWFLGADFDTVAQSAKFQDAHRSRWFRFKISIVCSICIK